MFNFKKKSVVSSRDSDLLIATDPTGKISVAFGIAWRTIVDSGVDPRKAAAKTARNAGATHLLFQSSQYGFGRINSETLAESAENIYAAAMVVARQWGGNGNSLFVIKVHDYEDSDVAEYWLAITRGGVPSSEDRVIRADNDQAAIDEAKRLLAEAAGEDESEGYKIFTNLDGAFGGNVEHFGPEQIFRAGVRPSDLLVPIPNERAQLPKPVLYVAAAGLVLLVGQQGWKKYQAYEHARLARLNVVVDEPPAQAWARVVSKWTSEHVAASRDGIMQARLSLGKVPLIWGAWHLETASCTAGPVGTTPQFAPGSPAAVAAAAQAAQSAGAQAASNGPHRTWSCSARYGRPIIGRENREVMDHVPEGWTVKFTGLSQLDASWQLQEGVRPIVIADLKPVKFHMVETASKLQSLIPAFTQTVNFAFANVNLPAPKRKDGKAVPQDASVPQLKESSLVIKAPLRSIDALLALPVPADWTRLSINFTASSLSNSSIKSSSIAAEAQGVIYAKD